VIWALSLLLYLPFTTAENEPRPPLFRMMSPGGRPLSYDCSRAIFQIPAGRDDTLYTNRGVAFRPIPPIPQSQILSFPQEFRDHLCIVRVWPSLPVWVLDYPPGPPGPGSPLFATLSQLEWAEVQDMSLLLLIWLERRHFRRGRIYMPLMNHHVTVEVWSGAETAHVPWDVTTPWA